MTSRIGKLLPQPALWLLAAVVIGYAVPVGAYWVLGLAWPSSLKALHYLVALAFLATALVILLEGALAVRRLHAPRHPLAVEDVPSTTVIVAAYLPNERDLIVETCTRLLTELEAVSSRLQVICAYNTPQSLPVERDLAELEALFSNFVALKVQGSTSKAENINAALALATGEMTVLLDADHHLAPDGLRRAGRWLADGYDLVQGRCAVRNPDESRIASIVAVEFEQMYALAHQGRSLLTDTAIFGGTNGFWRTSLLRRIAMDTEMLTEDIDSSIRALLAGARIVHDRSIVSTELATTTVPTWYSQRLRWAQGWFQVTLRHQRAIWQTDRLSGPQKAYWTYVLGWREIYPALSLQVLSLLTADLILDRPIEWITKPSLMVSAVFTILIGLLATVWTWKVSLQSSRDHGLRAYLLFALFSFPYTVARNAVAMIATLRELVGFRRWVVTRRVASSPATEVTS